MKIYKRAEFLKLPPGTIYAKGKPQYFGNLSVKGETLGNDWITLDLVWFEAANDAEIDERFDAMLEKGASYPMESAYGRDGCFDEEEAFLVWQRGDLQTLRQYIDNAMETA